MKKLVGVILCLVVGTSVCSAALNEQDQKQAQGQIQGQLQGQAQGQIGINEQGQTAVGEVTTSIDTDEKTLYKGAAAQQIPQGSDGIMALTPWGGPAVTNIADITKSVTYLNVCKENGLDTKEAIEWVRSAAKPRKFLGIPKTEGACRNVIVNLVCF